MITDWRDKFIEWGKPIPDFAVGCLRYSLDRNVERINFGPLPRPSRDIYESDEDGNAIFVRTKTEEEFDGDMAVYDVEAKRPRTMHIQGPIRITALFVLADESEAEAELVGDEWIITTMTNF